MKQHTISLSAALLCAMGLVSLAGGGTKDAPRKDAHGDDLPAGAVARLGTARWRHGGVVAQAVFLPDGKAVLSAGADRTIRVWEFPSGKELRRFGPQTTTAPALPGGVQPIAWGVGLGRVAFAVSKDGKTVAACFEDAAIQRWDVATGKELPALKSPNLFQPVSAVAFSPDGLQLASLDFDGTIRVWELKTAKELRQFATPNGARLGFGGGTPLLAYAQDSQALLSFKADFDNGMVSYNIKIWDPATGKEKAAIALPAKTGFNALVVAPDGKSLVVAGFDGSMTHFDLATTKEIRKIPGDQRGGVSLAFAPDGKKLYSRSMVNRTIREWDLAAGKELRQFGPPAPKLPAMRVAGGQANLAVSPDGQILAIAGESQVLQFVDLATGKELASATTAHQYGINFVTYTADGKQALTRSSDFKILRWDAATGKEIGTVNVPAPAFNVVVSPGAELLAVQRATNQGTVLVDATTGKEIGTIPSPKGEFFAGLAFAPTGKVLAVRWQQSKKVDLYDVPTLKPRCSIPVQGGNVANPGGGFGVVPGAPGTMIFSTDGQTLAAYADAGSFGVFDTATGKKRCALTAPEQKTITSGAFSPDGRTLALDLEDGTVSVWELVSARERHRLGHKQALKDPAAMAGVRVMILNSSSGLEGANKGSVAFSPNGKLLVLGGKDGKLYVWDAMTGRTLAELAGHTAALQCVAFAPDGKTLVSGSADTTALIWDMVSPAKKATLAAKVLAADDLQARWTALAGQDARKAIEAICDLAAAPEQAVPFLKANIKLPPALDAKRVEKLIAELDDTQFKVRQSASSELAKLGEQVVPFLIKALATSPPLEVRQRLETLRDQLTSTVLTGDTLQVFRAIEVLERIGTPGARQVLQSLADGPEGALVKVAAKAALERNK